MVRTRIIPLLLLKNQGLVKTVKFKKPTYIGDPINAVRIFNDKEVDELAFLDITATVEQRPPPFDLIAKIASECFMPLCYGGGIRTMEHVNQLCRVGVEKVALNSITVENSEFVREVAETLGSQSVVVSVDVRRNILGQYRVATRSGTKITSKDPVEHAVDMERAGAGEIILTSIDRDGTMSGYDLELIRRVTKAVDIPVVACGGARAVPEFVEALAAGASAVAAGSMFVFTGKHRAVLINFPSQDNLEPVHCRV
jgi:imidazole glycerol-phosphate synthase subunit HisF